MRRHAPALTLAAALLATPAAAAPTDDLLLTDAGWGWHGRRRHVPG